MSVRAFMSLIVLLCAVFAITYSWVPGQGGDVIETANRTPAADFAFRDALGNQNSLSDYQGKVVLLNFWATWCAPCRTEIPWFVEFEKQYKNEGFAVIGVSFDEEGWDVVGPYVAQQKMNYRLAVANDIDLPEPYNSIHTLPTTVIIDREGRIAVMHERLVSRATYEGAIAKLLAEDEPTSTAAR